MSTTSMDAQTSALLLRLGRLIRLIRVTRVFGVFKSINIYVHGLAKAGVSIICCLAVILVTESVKALTVTITLGGTAAENILAVPSLAVITSFDCTSVSTSVLGSLL